MIFKLIRLQNNKISYISLTIKFHILSKYISVKSNFWFSVISKTDHTALQFIENESKL
jgi:hypothetical protein